jgi:hypothetical protein
VSALLAGTALAATGLVITGAGPAAAVPVEGVVEAHADAQTDAGCALAGDSSAEASSFGTHDGAHTTHVTEPYSASQSATVAASGSVDIETTGSASAKARAFRRVNFESTGVVIVNNSSDLDCGLELTGGSIATATLKVRKRGKIKISWSSSVGDLELVKLTGPSGVLLSRDPSRPDGGATLRVKRGFYELESRFSVVASEADAAVGSSTSRIGFYSLNATYVS